MGTPLSVKGRTNRSGRVERVRPSAPRLTPPPHAAETTELGFPCTPHQSNRFSPRHEGCAGWWNNPAVGDDAGWLCSCDCHAEGAGWPGYDEWAERRLAG